MKIPIDIVEIFSISSFHSYNSFQQNRCWFIGCISGCVADSAVEKSFRLYTPQNIYVCSSSSVMTFCIDVPTLFLLCIILLCLRVVFQNIIFMRFHVPPKWAPFEVYTHLVSLYPIVPISVPQQPNSLEHTTSQG